MKSSELSAITTQGREDAHWFEAGVAEAPAWDKVSVTGLFDQRIDVHAVAGQVRDRLNAEIIIDSLFDRDWVRESIKAFSRFA